MSTNYAPGQPDDDDPRPDGAEVVPFPARTPDARRGRRARGRRRTPPLR